MYRNPSLASIPRALPLQQRFHLEVVSRGKVLNDFSASCPSIPIQVQDWISKVRTNFLAAESGVRWMQQLPPPAPNLPPLNIDVVVPYTKVFDCVGPTNCRITIPHPIPGFDPLDLLVPPDVCQKLDKGVYAAIQPLIQFKNRHFYQGIAPDRGWELVTQLRNVTNDNGTHLDGLKTVRDNLRNSCTTIAEFPTFKSAVKQLILDWNFAADLGLIPISDAWS